MLPAHLATVIAVESRTQRCIASRSDRTHKQIAPGYFYFMQLANSIASTDLPIRLSNVKCGNGDTFQRPHSDMEYYRTAAGN